MFFSRRRRRASGLSLTSLIVIGGVLYATGAGGWLTERISHLPAACFQAMPGNASVCQMVDRASQVTVNLATRSGAMLDGITGRVSGLQRAGMPHVTMNSATGGMPGLNLQGGSFSALQLPQFSLNHMQSDSVKQVLAMYLRAAQFGSPQSVNFSPERALGLHQQGASMGAFGLGSQLALGNAYAQGVGTAANPAQAKQYYQQALDSLNQLEGMSNADAHHYLQSFGSSPDAMRAALEMQIQALSR